MSGIIGHTMYAMLAAKAAAGRRLPIAPALGRQFASYLAGSYLGCDIQTLPEAICLDTGREVGYGTVKLDRSPITGGPIKPWTLDFQGQKYSPYDVHQMFYGRAHVVFGWTRQQRDAAVAWREFPGYAAAVVSDLIDLYPPGERALAYTFGWMTHVIGDSLIKSVHPGVTLQLLDGKYTPRNRPIQDLVTFHEIGRKELGLNWAALLEDLADTPVEPIQLHWMRVAPRQGRLGWDFPQHWQPQQAPLLERILSENRRYQRIRNPRILDQLRLRRVDGRRQCDAGLSQTTGGLSYEEMVEAAEKADFRHALWQIAEAVADLFEQVVRFEPRLRDLPPDGPTWPELTRRWGGG